MTDATRRAGHRRGPVPRALAWLALAAGLALSLVGLQRHAPPVAATAQAVAATGALLGAWQEGSPAAAGAWVAPAAAAPGGAWLAGLVGHLAQRVPPPRGSPAPDAPPPLDAPPPPGAPPAPDALASPDAPSPPGAPPASEPGGRVPSAGDHARSASGDGVPSTTGDGASPAPGTGGVPPEAGVPAPRHQPPAASAPTAAAPAPPSAAATAAPAEGSSPPSMAPPGGLLAVPLTGYAIGTARPDAAGRIHVATVLDVAVPTAGYAGRFVQDLIWRPTLVHPRLVAASGHPVLEIWVRGHRLMWRRPEGPWQPGLSLADLPRHGSPAGGPPGVPVEVNRDGFGPLALAGSRGVLLTTRGPRPLVALWPWRLDDPDARPGGQVVVLDVLYHATPQGWRVEAGGRHAVLTVAVEDGSRVEVTYDLDRGGPVTTLRRGSIPAARPVASGGTLAAAVAHLRLLGRRAAPPPPTVIVATPFPGGGSP